MEAINDMKKGHVLQQHIYGVEVKEGLQRDVIKREKRKRVKVKLSQEGWVSQEFRMETV